MTTERVHYQLTATGADEVQRKFRGVTSSMGSASQMSTQTATNVSALGGAVGNLGTVVTSASPQIGQFGGVIGTAASAVSGLSSVLGVAGGLAAGGVIAAIGLFATSMSDASEETSKLDDETKKLNNTLEKHIGLVQEANRERALAERVSLGVGTIQEQQARVEQIERRLRLVNQAAPGLTSRESALRAQDLRRDLERQLAEAREAAEFARRAQAEEALGVGGSEVGADLLTPEERGAGGGRDERGGRTAAGVAEFTQQSAAVDKAIAESKRRSEFLDRVEKARNQRLVEEAKSAAEAEADARIAEFDRFVQKRKDMSEDLEKLDQASERRAHQRMAAVTASAERFGEQGTEAFVRLASGQGDAAQAIIASIGDQMVAEGSRYVFRGGLELLGGNPSGGAMAALGLAEIAAGVGFGAALSSPAPGAAGGAGSTGPAEPTRIERDTSNIRRTTVINVDAMVADENAGDRIAQALEKNQRIRGQA